METMALRAYNDPRMCVSGNRAYGYSCNNIRTRGRVTEQGDATLYARK